MDEEGKFLFQVLLPSKKFDSSFKLEHYLAGFLILIDSGQSDEALRSSYEQLMKTLKELTAVIKQSYVTNNQFKYSLRDKPLLVFMTSTGNEPENCPSNFNLENISNPCLDCLELKTNYRCKFAKDLNAAMVYLLDQGIFHMYPEFVRVVSMQMSGLY